MLDIATQKSFQERLSAIRTLKQETLISEQEKRLVTIKDIGNHSFFEYLGNTYFVKTLHKYEETSENFENKKGYFIHELTCLNLETGETSNFEWEYDDELEVSHTLERLSFKNLKDDEGGAVDADDLEQIAEDKDMIVINGEKFWYEDDWASIYYRGDSEERVYMYEFENEKGSRFLTIEEWSGSGRDEYQIYTSHPVDPDTISIISRGEL